MTDDRQVLGVLMLDTNFPRPPGDIGNPKSFPFPVVYRTVRDTNAGNIVTDQDLPEDIVIRFLAEAKALQDQGVSMMTTSCGFLSPIQHRLQGELQVPIVTSALWILPALRQQYGDGATFGILTFDSTKLAARHIPDPGPYHVEGLEHGAELYRVIHEDERNLDKGKAEADAIAVTRRLIDAAPDTSAIVLECTNLPPYKAAIERESQLPVYDIRDALGSGP